MFPGGRRGDKAFIGERDDANVILRWEGFRMFRRYRCVYRVWDV